MGIFESITKPDARLEKYNRNTTLDCSPNCQWYRKINEEVCGWNEFFMYLVRNGSELKKCDIKEKIPERSSIDYLDKIKKLYIIQ